MAALTWFLLALVLLSPLFTPPGLAYPGVTGPGLLVRLLVPVLLLVYIARGLPWPSGPLAYALAGVAGALLITTATSVDPMLSLAGTPWRMTGAFDLLLWLLLAAMLPGLVRGQWHRVWALVLASGALLAVAGLVEWAWFSDHFGGRVSGITGNPGLLGVYLAATVVAAVGLTGRRRGWFAVLAVAIIALHLTGTRAAVLGAVAGLGVVLLYSLKPADHARGALAVVSAVLLGTLATFAPVTESRMDPHAVPVTHRVEQVGVAWSAFLARPLTGWGPGAYIHADAVYAPGAPERADHPHNIPLELLATMGVLSLPVFVAGGLLVWRLRREPLPLAVLVGLGVYGLFWFLSPHMLVWMAVVAGSTVSTFPIRCAHRGPKEHAEPVSPA